MHGSAAGVATVGRDYRDQQNAPVAATLIGEATDSVGGAAGRVWAVVSIVREFNDGINGPQPTPLAAGSNGNSPKAPPTRGESLRNATTSLHDGITALTSEIERLQRI